jgi:MoaA/NifB/PqqE/SkfB family radical SAM enzyme
MKESVVFDISSGICNAKCNWCYIPHLKKEFNLNKFMTVKDAQKIVEINKNQKLRIYFTGFGETLINPDFFEIVNLMHENFVLASIMTNFSKKLSKEQIRWLLFVFEKLVIEMGGLSVETRNQNMHINNDAFFENIDTLKEIFRENFSLKNSATIKILRNKTNNEEISKCDHPDEFNIILCSPIVFKEELYKNVTADKDRNYFLEKNYQEGVPIESEIISLECGCTSKRTLRIIPSGDVLMCCSSPTGAYLGNAYKTSLEEMINSKLYKENLEKMENRTYCENCRFCHE